MKRRVKGARREKFFKELTELVKVDKDMTFGQLPSNLKISSASFHRWRAKILKGAEKKSRVKRSCFFINYELIDRFIKVNPTSSYNSFCKHNPKISISGPSYYIRRKRLNGNQLNSKKLRELIREEIRKVLQQLIRAY